MREHAQSPEDHATFEETYPRYEFSELVRLTLLVGQHLRGRRRPHLFFGLLARMNRARETGRAKAAT